MADEKKYTPPAVSIPTTVMVQGPEAVKKFREKAQESHRNLVAAMVNIKVIKLNAAKRILFDITEQQTSGKVVLSLSAGGRRTARFGLAPVPELKDIPLHGLIAIANALKSGDLLNVTEGDKEIIDPMKGRPAMEKESPDPMVKLNKAERDRIVYIMNYEDGNPKKPANGNSLENIVKHAKRVEIQEVKAMLCVEQENKGRRDVVQALEEILYQAQHGAEEARALVSPAGV